MKTLLISLLCLSHLSPSYSNGTSHSPKFDENSRSTTTAFIGDTLPRIEHDSNRIQYFNALLTCFRQSCTQKYKTLLSDLDRLQKQLSVSGANKSSLSQQIAEKQAEIAGIYKKATHYEFHGGAVWRMAGSYAETPKDTFSLHLFALVKSGRMDEARLFLNANKAKQPAADAIQVEIERRLLDAELAQIQLKWDEAERNYEQALALDSLHEESNAEFATFLYNQGQFDRALRYYENLLKSAPTERDSAVCNSNMGGAYFYLNNLPAAEKSLNESLIIKRRLAQKDPVEYLPDLIRNLSNLAICYEAKEDITSAEKALLEALEHSRNLANNNSEGFDAIMAKVLFQLSELDIKKQDYDSYEKHLAESLAIYRRLSKSNPAAFEPYLAQTLSSLGIAYRFKSDPVAAEKASLESESIFRRLSQNNPLVFESDLANRLLDLGILYLEENKLAAKETMLNEALALNKRMADINPESFEPKVAFLYLLMGYVRVESAQTEQAKTSFENALTLAQKHPESSAAIYVKPNVELALVEQTVAPLNKEMEVLEGITALIPCQKKIAGAWENGLNKYPDNTDILEQVVWEYGTLARYFIIAENFIEAEKAARKGIGFDKEEPQLQAYLAHALLFQGKYAEAVSIYTAIKNLTDYEERPYSLICTSELNDFAASGITHPDADKVIELLGND